MWCTRIRRAMTFALLGAAALVAAWAGNPAASAGKSARTQPPASPQVPEPPPPTVRETSANLQLAFTNEMNAKQRYVAYAQRAEREGYPAVANLFRACAQAEQTHANAHVHAIAWTGQEARAMLERLTVGTTPENLRTAIVLETYETQQFYPPLLARARSDHQPEAVRSLTFALSAEREHVQLLSAAFARLDEHPRPTPIYVCPLCGKTVEALNFKKCPNCFTSAKKFRQEG